MYNISFENNIVSNKSHYENLDQSSICNFLTSYVNDLLHIGKISFRRNCRSQVKTDDIYNHYRTILPDDISSILSCNLIILI